MWTSKNIFSKLVDFDFLRMFKAANIVLFATLATFCVYSLDSKLQVAKQEIEYLETTKGVKEMLLQDSLELQNQKIDSLKQLIKKISYIKEHPLKPAFEMNSLFGEIYTGIEKSGIRCPEAMLALASHETGRFTSKLSRYNNYFGLAWSKHPLVTGKVWSEGDGHYKAVFASVEDCFRYMKEWQDKRQARLDFSSNERFVRSLKNVNYATAPDHGTIVLKCMNDLFDVRDINEEIVQHNQVERYFASR